MHIRFDGYEIGCTQDDEVAISHYEIGETEVDSHDTGRLGRDGIMPGTEPPRWALSARPRTWLRG